jgi:tetratricopeptide (TPR) repeat protein
MSVCLQAVNQLVAQNKFKKALTLLKKINANLDERNFESLQLEGACLINQKKYLLAEIILTKALGLATSTEQKLLTLQNLQVSSFKRGDIAAAIRLLKKSLALDSSEANAKARNNLCQLSFQSKQYNDVIEYGDKLLGLSEYSHSALFLILYSFLALGDAVGAGPYLDKGIAEVNALNLPQVKELFRMLDSLEDYDKLKSLINKLLPKHNHEPWFIAWSLKTDGQKVFTTNGPLEAKQSITPTEKLSTEFIVGTDPKTVSLIKKLVEQLKNKGAYFHPSLRIVEDKGDLSIKSYSSTEINERLMSVPMKCLPVLSDFSFGVDKELKLTCQPHKTGLNKHAHAIMGSMVSIYNATDKLRSWSLAHPLLSLKAYPELVDKLYGLRGFNPTVKKLKKYYDEKNWDLLLIESFFDSRRFSFTSNELQLMGIKKGGDKQSGLLTVIDFLNHKSGVKGYEVNHKSKNMEINALPDKETHEVFVQYNTFYDPLITYLNYGFLENNPPWLYSLPVTLITTTGLSIYIFNTPADKSKNSRAIISHIDTYNPSYIKRELSEVSVSTLIIPTLSAKDTLLQVLCFLLLEVDMEDNYNNEISLKSEAEHLEKQLLRFNFKSWYALGKDTSKLLLEDKDESTMALTTLVSLCDFSKQHIKDYMNYRGISEI